MSLTSAARSRVTDVVNLFATPLQASHYVELVNPLWSSHKLQARVEGVWDETSDARTITRRDPLDMVVQSSDQRRPLVAAHDTERRRGRSDVARRRSGGEDERARCVHEQVDERLRAAHETTQGADVQHRRMGDQITPPPHPVPPSWRARPHRRR